MLLKDKVVMISGIGPTSAKEPFTSIRTPFEAATGAPSWE